MVPLTTQGSPKAFPKDSKDVLKILEKPGKKQWFFNDFQIRVGLKLAPCWPTLANVGPCWLKFIPNWPSSKVSPRLAKVFTKALPPRPRFSQMSTKALPQPFQHLIFYSGCSIVLFSNFKVVSFWVRLSNCPVMAVFGRFFKTIYSNVSPKWFL